MNKVSEGMRELANKYGFCIKETSVGVVLLCKNTDGKIVRWIEYNQLTEVVVIAGNTDNCNLWFCKTRKDLTPKKIIEFVKELNAVLNLEEPIWLKELIDPEDWQEIADICDASEDSRYTDTF